MTRAPAPAIVLAFGVALAVAVAAQAPPDAAAPERLARLTADDYADMQTRLGVTAMRPGPSGNPTAPNAANTDESKANPYTTIPDPLVFDDGRPVRTARQWARRRAEILELFSREVYGRVPRHVPRVTWREVRRVSTMVAGRAVKAREVVGHVDNRAHPEVTVDIRLMLVTPADATGKVSLMIMLRGGGLPGDPLPPNVRPSAPRSGDDPPAAEQLIAAGWGYALLNPASVQADNGAGLRHGVIGLVNRGRPRRPDDWGALRAWAWGASRALDHLTSDPTVDASRVGIDGVSRYGKAALVTMASDTRFRYGLIASSGAGGGKLLRRNFGEAIENLTGSGEYHWFAGNFLRYGAAAGAGGARTALDLPVDAHQLIALCAPRPLFVSHGIPEQGDAHWIDQRGAWMATLAAAPVYELLGARVEGVSGPWRTTPMPAVNEPRLGRAGGPSLPEW